MFRPTRAAVGGRWILLTLLLLLLAILTPAAPLSAGSAAHAAAPPPPGPTATAGSPAAAADVPETRPSVLLREAQAYEASLQLKTFQAPIRFIDRAALHLGAPATAASSGILVDIDTNQVLWEADPHARRAPASTTKMMSALVGMTNLSPDQEIVVPPEATQVQYVETRLGLIPGERLTMRELWSGMLMVSANDAALAVADTTGMDRFVAAMNQQAIDLGLSDSHFVGPVGYPDDPGQYSSAYDLAAIATAGYRYVPLFRQLTATRDGLLPGSPRHQEYKLHNINRLLDIYPPAIGTKTGFTDDAGPVLVAMAERGGHHLVVVLMNAQHMFDQGRALLEWGFGQYGVPPLPPPPPGH